jgi:sugar lactone lactonase YvrE
MKKWLIGVGGVIIAMIALTFGTLHVGLFPRPLATALLGLRYPDVNPEQIAPSQMLATFAPGTFLEGIAVHDDGRLFVSGVQADQGKVWRYADGQVKEIASRPGFFGTLAFHPNGTLYATFTSGGFSDPTAQRWQLVMLSENNAVTPVVDFPEGATPNGICFDDQGNLYAADSALGQIWRVGNGAPTPEVWLTSELFAPQGMPGIPGANGIRLKQNAVYLTNSSSGEFMRVPIEGDGRAGAPTVIATGVTGDDFAFDSHGNAYITTHPYNVLIKVSETGEKITVGNAENGMIGATNAMFGRTPDDSDTLYVVTDGGAFLNLVPYPFNRLFPQDTGLPSILAVRVAQS